MLFLTCSLLHFGLPYLAKGFVFPSAKIVIKLQWQNRNELLVPIRALQRYRLVRYAGTVWSAMMVPIQALRWYRYKRYDGTVSPILSFYKKSGVILDHLKEFARAIADECDNIEYGRTDIDYDTRKDTNMLFVSFFSYDPDMVESKTMEFNYIMGDYMMPIQVSSDSMPS